VERPPLDGIHDVDTAVVGAGFTGLSAALHVALAGRPVIVVDAADVGWGASGRNNGQVIPTLSRHDPSAIVAQYGEAGERFVALLRDSAAGLFDLVRTHGLSAEAEQAGWVQPVHSPGRMQLAARRVDEWSRVGAPVELLTADELARKLGTRSWFGGWWNRTGGHINPLALCHALADKVSILGGQVYARSPVTALSRIRGRWVLTLPRARITARAVVVATNAYGQDIAPGLLPDLARSVIPVRSWQMATVPIGDDGRRTVLPERSAVSDTHGDLRFMRYDARHRLITGGALMNAAYGSQRLRRTIGRRLERLFPDLGKVRFEHVWNGYIGMTRDFMPHFHQLGPDGFAWVGCNGRAVALSLAIGREFARATGGVARRDLALPFTEPEPVPFHSVARRIAPLALLRHRWRDRREV
jgi:glycine/D-amino acid oxidase-like deaminating enzyme